jgi:YD repeat-containing protein
MLDSPCPDRDVLRAFAIGLLSEDKLSELCVHLEQCVDCRQRLEESLDAADELLALLQSQESLEGYEHEAECGQAIAGVLRAQSVGSTTVTDTVDVAMPSRQYHLRAKLGAGGMGAVFQVVHTRLGRVMALKVLLPERVRQPEAVARFDREIRLVGQLDHPNIVRPTDGGEENDVHFLVMEYVDGVDLSALVAQAGPLSIADACEIARQAAVGLQHAHQRSIVHRDIKPSNLMVDRCGTVKILDFGVANLWADVDEQLTTAHHVMGTLDYMAPEQADDAHEVDHRADLYGLGATLYKLLCGEAPLAAEGRRSVLQKLRALAAEEIRPIRQRRAEVPEELAAVLDGLLAKDPAARCQTAAEAAAALAPWATGSDLPRLLERIQPVPGGAEAIERRECETYCDRLSFLTALDDVREAGDSSRPGRANSALQTGDSPAASVESRALAATPAVCRAHPRRGWGGRMLAATAGIALVVVMLGVVIHLRGRYGELTIDIQPNRAQIVLDAKRPSAPAAIPSWFPAPPADDDAWPLGLESAGVEPALVGLVPRPARLAGIRHWQIRFAPLSDTSANDTCRKLRSVSWSPDGRLLAVAGGRGDVRLLSPDGRVLHEQLGAHTQHARPLAWSADGLRLATTGLDEIVRLWDGDLGLLRSLRDHQAYTLSAAWDPVSGRLASGDSAGKVLVWDAEGRLLKVLESEGWVWGLAWSPDGQRLAAQARNEIWLWDAELARGPTLHPDGEPVALAWSPDGSRLAVACMFARTAQIWTAVGRLEQVLRGHTDEVWAVAWSQDGQLLASAGEDRCVRIWQADGTLVHVLPEAAAAVLAVSFAPDGMLAACGYDGRVTAWDSVSGQPVWILAALEAGGTATFTAAGQLLGGNPEALEKSLLYVVQPEDGDERTMKPSEFYRSIKPVPAATGRPRDS